MTVNELLVRYGTAAVLAALRQVPTPVGEFYKVEELEDVLKGRAEQKPEQGRLFDLTLL